MTSPPTDPLEQVRVRLLSALEDASRRRSWNELFAILDQDPAAVMDADAPAVLAILKTIPDDVLEKQPRWQMSREYIDNILNKAEKAAVFRFAGGTGPGDTPLDVLAQHTADTVTARGEGDLRHAINSVNRASHAWDEMSPHERGIAGPGIPDLRFHWGQTREAAGQLRLARAEYSASLDFAITYKNRMMEATAGASLAWLDALHGRNEAARARLARMPTGEGSWWASLPPVPAVLAQALMLADAGKTGEADAALSAVDADRALEHWAAHHFVLARSVAVTRDRAVARSQLIAFEHLIDTLPPLQVSRGANAAFTALTRFILLGILRQDDDAFAALHDVRLHPAGTVLRQLAVLSEGLQQLLLGHVERAHEMLEPLTHTQVTAPRILIPALTATALYRARTGMTGARERLIEASTIAAVHAPEVSLIPLTEKEQQVLIGAVPEDHTAIAFISSAPERHHQEDPLAPLTRAERRIAGLIAAGARTTETAAELHLSPHTVRWHLKNIYRKLQITNRDELIGLLVRP